MTTENPVGLNGGIEFVEFNSSTPGQLDDLFKAFGFSKLYKHKSENHDMFCQGKIKFLINRAPNSFSAEFEKIHGPCVSSMGWRVNDSKKAYDAAIKRGAVPAERQDYFLEDGSKVPAIMGIGDSIIYFMEPSFCDKFMAKLGFVAHDKPVKVEEKGFQLIDHLTNNVYKGEMEKWANFYKDIFGFTEIRYFDIKGAKTGLISYALKAPDSSFCIPINEGTDSKSQINEYLDEYKGAGVQHIALLTDDILGTLGKMEETPIDCLDIDDEYYDTVFDRVPNVSQDHAEIKRRNVLVDGDDEGYLLQIFTKNVIGPIFVELIQRENHHNFGEGNFGALFRAIERDQEKRGVL